jgi:sugar-specific transcriptional regulator TrmB
MSLKDFTKELFTRYGFTEDHINIYLVYLRVPRATPSEVYMSLVDEHEGLQYETVLEVTNWLVEKGFLKRIEGIVDRYIPLQPYFELFTSESENFRNEIGKIKDTILADQSDRFEKLEAIQDKSIGEVEKAVDTQIKAFFEDSDSKNNKKKNRIVSATNRFTETNKALERKIHAIMDTLNSNLKNISETSVNNNEAEISKTKDNLTTQISNLLNDFSTRVENLDKELKMELDEHVERHKNIANQLKPKIEQILEKYLERMDKVVTDLKAKISNLLKEHTNHVKNTTDTLQTNLKATVDERHRILTNQTNDFKSMTLTLIDNLLEHANRFTDFTEDMAKKGFFWMGKKKKYKARHKTTIENILKYTEPMKPDFEKTCDDYIINTRGTTEEIKTDLTDIMAKEHDGLATETNDLDYRSQETIDAQLETLATDLAGEVDDTLQSGVKDCSDTRIKLKDSLESSLKQHHRQYDDAINNHKEDSLKHYTDFDIEVKSISADWTRDVNTNFEDGKRDCSDKIDSEIRLWDAEAKDMNTNLTDMLADHKSKYEQNAKTLQNSLSNTTRDTAQNVKDAIADFTLQFMNSIDDATELAENNEEKLTDIHTASSAIPEIAKVTTWPVVGKDAMIAAIKDAIYRVKSSIIIVTPYVVPDILQVVSEYAFQKKAVRFMLTSRWELDQYKGIIAKMKQLGNIQFRQLQTAGEFFAVTRDAEEVILAPATEKEAEMIAVVSNQEGYSRLYSQFIGPIFQANSRPIK